jgi:septum formation protein
MNSVVGANFNAGLKADSTGPGRRRQRLRALSPTAFRLVKKTGIWYGYAMSLVNRNSNLILASKSPRRRQLLEQAGLKVTVVPSDFSENSTRRQDPTIYARVMAEGKSRAVARLHPDDWVIGAYTIVVVDHRILGKPASGQEARAMLGQLSGRAHEVYTGWCLQRFDRAYRFSQTVKTEVYFKHLSPDEIEWYLQTGEPFDKAGAYGIQGPGAFLVKEIRGSYTNVVGLPICEVFEHLLTANIVQLNPSRSSPERMPDLP